MKYLFYISTISGGGAARVMVNIANGLAEQGFEVSLVTNFRASHEYSVHDRIERYVVESTEDTNGSLKKNLNRIQILRRLVKDIKPDICVSFMVENNFRLMISTIGLKTKTVVSVRNDPAKEYPTARLRKLAELLYKRADGVVFQTEDAKAFFSNNIQKKSRIIFNQVDERFFEDQSTEQGEYIVACGRLTKQKNYPMMIKAFSDAHKNHETEELRIYGEGDLQEELIKMVRESDLEKSVHFMGFSSDMVDVYRHAKLLIMTSDYEGMPNAILEALASGVPVISTDCPCGGPKMVIEPGVNGYLVPVGDSKRMGILINELLDDNDKLSAMKEKAKASADQFRSDTILKEWISYLSSV